MSALSAASRLKLNLRPLPGQTGIDILRAAALAILLICGILTPGFLSRVSLLSLATSASFTGCVAAGMTFITLSGNIMSFSLGITLSVTTMVFVSLLPMGGPTAAAAALLFSAIITGLQGWLTGYFRANPVIVSLAALSAITGLATWITGGRGVYPEGNEAGIFRTAIGPIPLPLVAFLAVILAGQAVLHLTRFGRNIVMVGSNRRAAEVAGIEPWQAITGAYALAGLFTGVAAVLMAARYSSGDLELGSGYDYSAISALLVGGTAIEGGRGSPLRTMFGAFGIAIVQVLLVLWSFSTQMQFLVTGVIVLAAIMLQTAGARK